MDEASGLPRAVTPDKDTHKKLLDFLLNDVKPQVAEIIAAQRRS